MIYMNSRNNNTRIWILLTIVSLCFSQCNGQNPKSDNKEVKQEENDYKILENYLLSLSDTLLLKNYDAVLFLSESGCPGCNKSFANTIEKFILNKNNVLVILNAKGQQLNIHPFLSEGLTNVVKDFSNDFYRLGLFLGSGIILLKEGQIENIIVINSEKLQEKLTILKQL